MCSQLVFEQAHLPTGHGLKLVNLEEMHLEVVRQELSLLADQLAVVFRLSDHE